VRLVGGGARQCQAALGLWHGGPDRAREGAPQGGRGARRPRPRALAVHTRLRPEALGGGSRRPERAQAGAAAGRRVEPRAAGGAPRHNRRGVHRGRWAPSLTGARRPFRGGPSARGGGRPRAEAGELRGSLLRHGGLWEQPDRLHAAPSPRFPAARYRSPTLAGGPERFLHGGSSPARQQAPRALGAARWCGRIRGCGAGVAVGGPRTKAHALRDLDFFWAPLCPACRTASRRRPCRGHVLPVAWAAPAAQGLRRDPLRAT